MITIFAASSVMLFYMHILVIALANSSVSDPTPSHDETFSSKMKPYIESFVNFKNNLKNFFDIRFDIIEETRQTMKRTIKNYLGELSKTLETNFADNGKESNVLSHENVLDYIRPPIAISSTSRVPINILEDRSETSTVRNLITCRDYPIESQEVITDDGFILTVYRMRAVADHYTKKQVILYHDLFGSSDDWLQLGRDKALPYLFSKAGYDVWLPNARGNRYSKTKMNSSENSPEFWNFSWHEMGLYDLPAILKHIKKYTKDQEGIRFIGHGMGATVLLVLLSMWPKHEVLLHSATLLAPLAFLGHVKRPLRLFYSKTAFNSLNTDAQEFMLTDGFPRQVIEKLCKGKEETCSKFVLLITNGAKEILYSNHMYGVTNRLPARGSMKSIVHYAQLVASGHFQLFDYGLKHNLKKYGNECPPKYNLTHISLPIIIFSSPYDLLSTPDDVTTLKENLQHVIEYFNVTRYGFNHTDFVCAHDVDTLVYNKIFGALHLVNMRTGKVLAS